MAIWCGVLGIVAIATMFPLSTAVVNNNLKTDLVIQGKTISISCTVSGGEGFIGWFLSSGSKVTDNTNAQVHVAKVSGNEYQLKITNVKVSNGGTYVCRGDKNGRDTFTLEVEFIATHIDKKQYLRLETNDKIRVGVHGYPDPTFEWKKNGQVFNGNTGRYRSQADGSIAITDVKVVDRGNYTLHISQLGGRRSADIKIEVVAFEPPIMVEAPLPATRSLTVGFNTTFHCRAKGYPPPTYLWLNPILKPISTFNPRFTIDGGNFYITDIQRADKGTYTCVANNVKDFKVNATAEISNIYVRPTLQSKYLYDVIVEHGELATLDCVADGYPLPKVRWMRDGRFEMRQTQLSRRSVIKLPQATKTDVGKYVCEAWNNARDEKGQLIVAQETIGLYIRSKPTVNDKGTQRTVYSYLGNPKPVFIRCNFEGYPFPNVTIWFDNIQIANGTEVAIFDIITNELEDFGDYYCWSWNLYGSKNVTVSLKHAKSPSRPTKVVANVTCDSVMLTWDEPKDNGGMDIVHYVLNYGGQRWNTKDTYPQYFIEELKRGTVYTINIQARNKMGVGDYETVTITTKEFCAPGHPIIWHPREEVIEDTAFFLRWREPQNSGGDNNIRYRVVLSEDLDEEAFPIKSEETGVTEFFVDDLKFGMQYQIEVFAYNQGGWSLPAVGLYEVPSLKVRSMKAAKTSSSTISINVILLFLTALVTMANINT